MTLRAWAKCAASLLAFGIAHGAESIPSKLHRIDPVTSRGLQEILEAGSGPLPFVSAHRGGAWRDYPENCIATFERTLGSTYAILEIDPRYTRDGAIVVHHDPGLERTTTGKGRLVDVALREVRELWLKDPEGKVTGYRVPTLDEVIEWARGKTVLILDQKDVGALDRAKVVTRHRAEGHAMLIVGNFRDVVAVHRFNPDIMMEVFIGTRAKAEEFDSLGVPWRNVIAFVGHEPPTDPAIYDYIHRRGARCIVGTSRNLDRQVLGREGADIRSLEPAYRALLGRGADLIETDIPVLLGPMLHRDAIIPPALRRYFHPPGGG